MRDTVEKELSDLAITLGGIGSGAVASKKIISPEQIGRKAAR